MPSKLCESTLMNWIRIVMVMVRNLGQGLMLWIEEQRKYSGSKQSLTASPGLATRSEEVATIGGVDFK